MTNAINLPLKPKHLWLINIAKSLKTSHQTGQMFITAFALKGKRILAIGCNNYNIAHPEKQFGKYRATQDRGYDYKSSLHAEIKCLKELGPFRTDYHKIEIFIVRIGNEKGLPIRYSCPCLNCQRVLTPYKFKRIEFTTNSITKIGRLIK